MAEWIENLEQEAKFKCSKISETEDEVNACVFGVEEFNKHLGISHRRAVGGEMARSVSLDHASIACEREYSGNELNSCKQGVTMMYGWSEKFGI